jgi:hypothetical protein
VAKELHLHPKPSTVNVVPRICQFRFELDYFEDLAHPVTERSAVCFRHVLVGITIVGSTETRATLTPELSMMAKCIHYYLTCTAVIKVDNQFVLIEDIHSEYVSEFFHVYVNSTCGVGELPRSSLIHKIPKTTTFLGL